MQIGNSELWKKVVILFGSEDRVRMSTHWVYPSSAPVASSVAFLGQGPKAVDAVLLKPHKESAVSSQMNSSGRKQDMAPLTHFYDHFGLCEMRVEMAKREEEQLKSWETVETLLGLLGQSADEWCQKQQD